jgi:hypothetical protein
MSIIDDKEVTEHVPKKVYEVPFTFRYTGRLVVYAESHEAAFEQASEELAFDRSNVQDSNVFFDELSPILDDKCVDAVGAPTVKAELGTPVESTHKPDEFGFEDDELRDEFDPDLENPRSTT